MADIFNSITVQQLNVILCHGVHKKLLSWNSVVLSSYSSNQQYNFQFLVSYSANLIG